MANYNLEIFEIIRFSNELHSGTSILKINSKQISILEENRKGNLILSLPVKNITLVEVDCDIITFCWKQVACNIIHYTVALVDKIFKHVIRTMGDTISTNGGLLGH